MRGLQGLLLTAGALAILLLLWLWRGWPLGVDAWLDVSEPPAPAVAIVCLAGGSTSSNLPLPPAWPRIDTAAQLFADGWAPVIVFSGGGTSEVSEAEIYGRAAEWLGVPRASIVLDPRPQSTADHAKTLIGLQLPDGRRITTESPLLIVTSPLHARRARMTMLHAGFTSVRVVHHYAARQPIPGSPRSTSSKVAGYTPSQKRYDDPLLRLSTGSADFFLALREVAALGWYWWQGAI